MRRNRFALLALAAHFGLGSLVAGPLVGCGGPQEDEDERGRSGRLPARVEEDGRLVRPFDVNRDGEADTELIFEAYDEDGFLVQDPVAVETYQWDELVIVERHADLNFDGEVDQLRYYEDGVTARELFDYDFDGEYHDTRYYEEGIIVRHEVDYDIDGVVDEMRYYRAGGLHRIEHDLDDDGYVDEVEQFEDNSLARVGFAGDGSDEEIEAWVRTRTGNATMPGSPGSPGNIPRPGGGMVGDDEPTEGSGDIVEAADEPIEGSAAPAEAADEPIEASEAPTPAPAEGSGEAAE